MGWAWTTVDNNRKMTALGKYLLKVLACIIIERREDGDIIKRLLIWLAVDGWLLMVNELQLTSTFPYLHTFTFPTLT
jgi:hypothetical protein